MSANDQSFDVDNFLEIFSNSFSRLLEEMRDEPIQQIKDELR